LHQIIGSRQVSPKTHHRQVDRSHLGDQHERNSTELSAIVLPVTFRRGPVGLFFARFKNWSTRARSSGLSLPSQPCNGAFAGSLELSFALTLFLLLGIE
jgi:hypothetical protein